MVPNAEPAVAPLQSASQPDGEPDGAREVALAAQQRRRHDRGVVDRVYRVERSVTLLGSVARPLPVEPVGVEPPSHARRGEAVHDVPGLAALDDLVRHHLAPVEDGVHLRPSPRAVDLLERDVAGAGPAPV